ncbi:MAG: C10 family peptidase [Bacteroidales bacterium]|nr:C10 family peptidase [Bacteroidales bacterium]
MRKFVLLLFFGLLSFSVFSGPVTIEEARRIAKNIYFERVQQKMLMNMADIVITEEFVIDYAGDPAYYIFNIGKEHGFVIVAADDVVYPVLAYSFEGAYRTDNHHPSFRAQMSLYERQIVEIRDDNPLPVAELTEVWSKYNRDDFSATKDIITIGPWCTTKWDQGLYYNDSTPGGSVTGCVATAMAQVMKSFKHPKTGKGSHYYMHPYYGKQYANFGATTYDYSKMPDIVTSPNPNVAQLMYHCGVSVDMNYAPGGSGASMFSARDAFDMYFRYNFTAHVMTKNSVDDETWKILVRAELIDGAPVMYSGPNHAFVCDGFHYPDHFHFNWGWGGSYNGYFYMTNLNPGYSNYTNGQDAILQLYPDPMDNAEMPGGKISLENNLVNRGVEITVLPNPVTDVMSIAVINDDEGDALCSIIDLNGRVLKTFPFVKISGMHLNEVPVDDIPDGLYLVTVKTDNKNLTTKCIVQR